jgi:hypothetical protein
MSAKGLLTKKDNYSVEVKYSSEAINKKLVRFTVLEGNSLEISADDLISILVNQVSSETLEPTFVDSERINVVEVSRQLECVLEEDMKKGDKIRLNYIHPYPLEFALLEEVYKVAKLNTDVPALVLTKEYIEETREKLKPEMTEFMNKFYKSFRNIKTP